MVSIWYHQYKGFPGHPWMRIIDPHRTLSVLLVPKALQNQQTLLDYLPEGSLAQCLWAASCSWSCGDQKRHRCGIKAPNVEQPSFKMCCRKVISSIGYYNSRLYVTPGASSNVNENYLPRVVELLLQTHRQVIFVLPLIFSCTGAG